MTPAREIATPLTPSAIPLTSTARIVKRVAPGIRQSTQMATHTVGTHLEIPGITIATLAHIRTAMVIFAQAKVPTEFVID